MIYLVSGMMRSGTSMMMQCLETGGLSVVRSPGRDEFNTNHSDAAYRPNPESLYEPDESEMARPGFPRWHDGKALKLVAPWLGRLAVHEYRVLFLRRDPEEIRQSLEAAFNIRRTAPQIEAAVAEALATLRNRRDVLGLTTVDYRAVVSAPVPFFRGLQKLGWPIDPEKAAAVVDPGLYRFRREVLTPGLSVAFREVDDRPAYGPF